MDREDIIRYKNPLIEFIDLHRRINTVFIVSIIVLYSLSLFLLLKSYLIVAVILATLGFVLAKLMLMYSTHVSLYFFKYRKPSEEVLLFIDRELEKKDQNKFIITLAKALEMLDSL